MSSRITLSTLEDAATIVNQDNGISIIQFPLSLWTSYKTGILLDTDRLLLLMETYRVYLLDLLQEVEKLKEDNKRRNPPPTDTSNGH